MVDDLLTIGEVAARTGLSTSALRFYEREGLLQSERTAGGQRRYPREVLRRVAFVRVAQSVGLDLEQITGMLASLPQGRTPDEAGLGSTVTRLAADARRAHRLARTTP